MVMANWSLEWTSANWPRYAHQFIIAARGQLSSAPQLQRWAAWVSAPYELDFLERSEAWLRFGTPSKRNLVWYW